MNQWVRELRQARDCILRDDHSSALSFARARQGNLSPYAATVCRYAYWRARDLDAFYSLPRGTRMSRRDAFLGTLDSSMEAALEFEQLRLAAARHVAMDALAVAINRFPFYNALCAAPASIAAMVSYEQGFIGEAVDLVRGRLGAINSAGTLDCALRAYWVLARAAAGRGEFEGALTLWREAEQLGLKRSWPRLIAMSIAERVRSFSQRGSFSLARTEATQFERLGADTAEVREYRALTHAYIALTEPPSLKSVEAFRSLYDRYTRRRNLHAAMSTAVYIVCAFERLGAAQDAERLLLSILRPARAAGAFQLVLDGGNLVFQVLERIHNWPTDRELMPYISSLLNRRSAVPSRAPIPALPSAKAPKVIHGLSPRERDILVLVGRGLTNKRIAYALTITPETVKSHVKRIFSKLDVRTRAEAVSLGLRGGLFQHD